MSRTITSNLSNGITVSSSNPQYNPLYIYQGVTVDTTGNYGIAGESSILLTIVNFGAVIGSTAGVYLDRTSDTLTNAGTASHIGGFTDGILARAAPIITNVGTITGGSDGIYLEAGGTITNRGPAAIISTFGGNYGVRIIGGSGVVTNQGTIYSNAGAGVDFLAGGTLTNSGTASLIRGKSWGMYFGYQGGTVTVTNQGTIRGTDGPGIRFGDGGVLTNSTGALIYGLEQGVSDYNNAATIVNQGLIEGETLSGMYLKAGGTVTNSGTAALISGKYFGLYFKTGGASLLNQGTIKSTGAVEGWGIWFVGGGALTNSGSGAWIYGLDNGVDGYSGATTIINQGLIQGGLGSGVVLNAGGYVWNKIGGHIYGETDYGIKGVNNPFSVTNQGIIKGFNGWAIDLADGGTVTNVGTAAWINGGIEFGGTGASTVIDQGIIEAGDTNAVVFANVADNLLVLYPGASVTGTLLAGTGTGNKLDLRSGSAIGTLSSPFSGFQTIDVESGARWSLGGNDTVDAGSTLSLAAASSSLTITGSLVALGALTLAGSGTLAMSGAGDIQVGTGGTVAAGQLVIDSGQTLVTTGDVSVRNVKNQGVVSGASSYGLYLGNGGTVVNASGARITASFGIDAASGTTTVTNQGTGIISGAAYGVFVKSLGAGTVINQGTIRGSSGDGVDLEGGGAVTNEGTGTISGGTDGVSAGGFATVTNQATITGTVGVFLETGGFVTNSGTTSHITGSTSGVSDEFGGGVVNHGIITATNGVGITLQNGGVVTNAGTIGGTADAVKFAPGASGIVEIYPGAVFQGTVNGGNTIGAAVVSDLELMASANTIGTLNGVGTQFTNFAYITVSSGATWTIPGTIGSGITVMNSGTLPSGITLAGGAILTNTASGTITATSVAAVAVYGTGVATVVNAGLIHGFDGIAAWTEPVSVINQGTISGPFGIYLADGGTVINAGVIKSPGGVAVEFGNGVGGRLVVDPGAAFSGQVDGAATSVSTLEFAAGTGTPTLTTMAGLGSQFVLFNDITIDSGASWSLRGSVAAGSTLANDGHLVAITLAPGAILTNQSSGTITAATPGLYTHGITGLAGGAASVANAGSISGIYGGIYLYGGGTVTNQGRISGQEGIGVRFTNAGGGVINSGTAASIYGGDTGIAAYDTPVTISNDGTILGAGTGAGVISQGIYSQFGGSFTNTSTAAVIQGHGFGISAIKGPATIINAGRISGVTQWGIYSDTGSLSVTNQGTASVIAGASAAIYVTDAVATVVNQGQIFGSDEGDAVALAAGFNNRLVVFPNAQFVGTVDGAHSANGVGAIGTGVSTLELAGAGTFGELLGLGSQFTNFSHITIDSGAYWAVLGTIGNAQTLDNAGRLSNGVTLLAGAELIDEAGAPSLELRTLPWLRPARQPW